jgi:single-strand DNA-binding protein
MADVNSLNFVILIGHVCQDAQLVKMAKSGKHFAKFTIATNEKFRGVEKQTTEFHPVVVFGDAKAKFCEAYLHKGRMVMVKGKLRHRYYVDKDGVKRKYTQVNADQITIIGKRSDVDLVPTPKEEEEESTEPGGDEEGQPKSPGEDPF